MAIGFVLINTEPGMEQTVRNSLDGIPYLTNKWILFGEFDLIARIQTEDEFTLTKTIVEDIRTIDGITDTKTLIGAEL